MAGAGPLRAAVGLAVASALLLALVVIPKSSGRVALEGAYAVSSADLLRVMDQADQEAARGMSPEDLPVRQISGLRKGGHLRQTEGNIGQRPEDFYNMPSEHGEVGPDDSWKFYNKPSEFTPWTDDQSYKFYNDMDAPRNCVGGDPNRCCPDWAIAEGLCPPMPGVPKPDTWY